MIQHRWRLPLKASAVVVAMLIVFAACSDSSDKKKSSNSSTATTKAAAVSKTSDVPKTTGYVGARKDVTNLSCKQDGKLWKVSGTVSNPTDAAANYRIYTSFLDQSNETRGLLQSDVNNLAPHQAKDWSGELELDATGLHCGLRVERTGVGGAPPPTESPTTTKP